MTNPSIFTTDSLFSVPPRAIFFDFDGTLADATNVRKVFCATLEEYSITISDEELESYLSKSPKETYPIIYGDKAKDALEYSVKLYKQGPSIKLFEGVLETLELLKSLSHSPFLAIVSNKPDSLLQVETKISGINKYFTDENGILHIVGEQKDMSPKPDTPMVLKALEGTGLTLTKNMWFVGDSAVDVQTAANAGLTSILINAKKGEIANVHKVDARVKDFTQLQRLIKEVFCYESDNSENYSSSESEPDLIFPLDDCPDQKVSESIPPYAHGTHSQLDDVYFCSSQNPSTLSGMIHYGYNEYHPDAKC